MKRLSAAALIFALASLAPAARAQQSTSGVPPAPASPPSADDATQARAQFTEGIRLYQAKQFGPALDAFAASYRASGSASALQNVGQCYRDLDRLPEAYDTYEQVLARHSAALKDADRAAIRTAMHELVPLLGRLKVVATPPDATVTVDGASLPASRRARVGLRRVVVAKEGFETKTVDVAVSSDQESSVTVTLSAAAAHLVVRETQGEPVHVLVDGVDRGPAPWQGDLASGQHTVELRGNGVAAVAQTVTLSAGERREVASDAIPTPGATVPSGVAPLPPPSPTSSEPLAPPPPPPPTAALPPPAPPAPETPREPPTAPPVFERFFVHAAVAGVLSLAPARVQDQPDVEAHHGLAGGGAFALSGGVRVFGPLSIGAGVGLLYEAHHESWSWKNHGVADDFAYHSVAVLVGPGARLTSSAPFLRFTGALHVGASVHSFSIARTATNTTPASFDGSAGYTSLGVMADGGVLLGATGGLSFFAGLVLWLDVPPKQLVVGPDYENGVPADRYDTAGWGHVLADGPQAYFGPTLGVHWGPRAAAP